MSRLKSVIKYMVIITISSLACLYAYKKGYKRGMKNMSEKIEKVREAIKSNKENSFNYED